MIQIENEIILTGLPGDEIQNFINEALIFCEKHYIERCLFKFNGWYYLYDTKHITKSTEQIVELFYNFCSRERKG